MTYGKAGGLNVWALKGAKCTAKVVSSIDRITYLVHLDLEYTHKPFLHRVQWLKQNSLLPINFHLIELGNVTTNKRHLWTVS